MTLPDFPDWAIGHALVHAPVSQVATAFLTLGGAQEVVEPIIGMSQIGLDVYLALEMPTNMGTVPFGQLRFDWTDPTSAQVIWTEEFLLCCGNNNFAQHQMQLLAKGGQVTVSLTNLDSATTLTYQLIVTQHSRPQPKDKGFQLAAVGVNGFNQPGGRPRTGEHCNTSPSIGPNASVTRLMPFSMGKHTFNVANLSGANAMSVSVNDAATNDLITKYAVAANSADVREITLPNSTCQLTLANTQATNTITPNFTSMREDY